MAPDVLLDGRLALYHQRENWLALADLHFGYELSTRAAGWLTPLWGMKSIDQRVRQLLAEYQPRHLVFVGDLVHDRTALSPIRAFLKEISAACHVVLVAGNHDRHITDSVEMVRTWETDGFHFHHGHCAQENGTRTQIIGHHHPAGTLSDGAGLRLKLPAFVQEGSCWILPAFSPWAAGTAWKQNGQSRMWLCSPQRILLVETTAA